MKIFTLKLLRIPGSAGLGWTWGIGNIQEKQDWGSAEGGEGQLAFSQGQVAMVLAHRLWERQPATCLRKASRDSVLVSGEQPTLRETVPWFTASAGFPAGIILTRAGFKLPTWRHCTRAWEELQEAWQAGSSTPLFARSLQDKEGIEGKVTEPGRTLSPSIVSLGQQEFLENFLLDTSRLNSKTSLLVYSSIRSQEDTSFMRLSYMPTEDVAVLFSAVFPAPKSVPASY